MCNYFKPNIIKSHERRREFLWSPWEGPWQYPGLLPPSLIRPWVFIKDAQLIPSVIKFILFPSFNFLRCAFHVNEKNNGQMHLSCSCCWFPCLISFNMYLFVVSAICFFCFFLFCIIDRISSTVH